eukprot:scaffold74833_cov63-Phaeocystis_antarctica.AAC.1
MKGERRTAGLLAQLTKPFPFVWFNRPRPRAAMALLSLSGDEQRILFIQLCNVLDPRLPQQHQPRAAGANAGAAAAAEG